MGGGTSSKSTSQEHSVTPSELDTAQAAINQLFEALGVKRVISVDDLYAEEDTLEDLIGLLTDNPAAATSIPELADLDLTVDDDIWHDRLRTTWDAIGAERHVAVVQQVRAATGDQALDTVVGGVLAQLFEKYEFLPLTLAQWQAEKTALLEAASMLNTVVLFDQSFTKEGGSDTAGIGLIQDAYARCPHPGPLCGLLSQNYTVAQEFDGWQRLAKDHNLETDRFVLIAKERLQGQLTGFATQIKLAVLNHQCNELKNEAIEVLAGAHGQAANDLRAMNIYDFEHIVFRSSYREGIWEPDTLFRVFALYHRAATRNIARQSATLAQRAASIRKVSNLPIPEAANLPHGSWKIQRLELYDDQDHLNNHYLPTELGDIYQKTSGDKRYILLAQPCDLMVRNQKEPGRRPSTYEATIAEIVDEPPNDSAASAELKYFNPETGRSAYVHFGRIHTIKLCVLDLCAFRTDGIATLRTTDRCPDGVIPSWQRYFGALQLEATKLLKRYQDLKKTDRKDKALIAVVTRASHKGVITADLNEQEKRVEYHIKRVRRLLQPRAGEILTRYAAYTSRDAFEHDFADLPPNPSGTPPAA
jgi:hypothetical protein